MLVAVAAMAFVACSEVSVEVDNIKRNYVFDVNAGINNDTRAYFGEAKDGIYPIYWDGTENVRFEAQGDYGDGATGPYGTMSKEMTISDDATRAMFKIEFYDVSLLLPGTIDAYVGAIDNFGNLSISGNTQTPNVDSIDKEYFALKAEFPYDGVSTTLVGDFVHLSAYSKMTVEGFDGVELDNVAIIADDNTYNLNVKGLDTKTYWFAAVPDANVNNLTIEATTVDGVLYTKTYTLADGKLAFNAGRISNFTAKGFEKYVAPAFTSEVTSFFTDGDYNDILLIFSSEELGTLQLNFYGAFDGNSITPGTFYLGNQIYIGSGTDYSYYKPAGSETAYQLDGGSVIVSVTEDKKYHFEFKDITYNGTNTLNATYTGDVDGFGMPDLRTKLDAPEPTVVLDGKTAKISWESIPGAVAYRVFTQNYEIDETTTETSITLNFEEYSEYYINVKAVAAADDSTYQDSNATAVRILIEDNRQYLPVPTNVTATIDGPNATISWDAVEGADSYQVYYYLNEQKRIDVAGTSITLEVGYDVSNLWVYVFSIANNDNLKYRSSNSWDASVVVNTGKDPNVFADYEYTSLVWNSPRFDLDGLTLFTMNANDRPNNNSIKPGLYSYAGNSVTNPDTGKFSLYKVEGSFAGSTWYIYNASMEVAFEDNQYIIKITIIDAGASQMVGKTFGYRGMPDGWVAPSGGSESELTALETPVVTATASETENSITVSWSEVANAVGYKVTFNGNTETVTDFTKTYTGLDWSTKYNVEVVAVAATDSEEYKDSAAGTASATTIANPNTGGGETTQSFENWTFNMTLSTATGELSLTDGNHTVTAKLVGRYGLGVGSYIINDTTGVYYATDVKVNGVAVSNAEGQFRLNNSYKIELDMTLDGVKYTGTSSNGL